MRLLFAAVCAGSLALTLAAKPAVGRPRPLPADRTKAMAIVPVDQRPGLRKRSKMLGRQDSVHRQCP